MNGLVSGKLAAVVRYEILMAWRRRSLPILWLLLLVGVLGFALLVSDANEQVITSIEAQVQAGIITLEQFHTRMLFNIMVAAMIFYSVGVTLMVGEVIPLDTQFRLRELLDTLPITRAIYLGGKLLGVWGGLIIGWALVGIISIIALPLLLGAFDWRVFFLLWLLLPLPAALTSAALSVLVAALVKTRRAALMIGLLVLPFAFYLNAVGVINFVNLTVLIDPFYTYGSPLLPSNDQIVLDAVRGLLIHAGVIALVWGIVLLIVRWRDLR